MRGMRRKRRKRRKKGEEKERKGGKKGKGRGERGEKGEVMPLRAIINNTPAFEQCHSISYNLPLLLLPAHSDRSIC